VGYTVGTPDNATVMITSDDVVQFNWCQWWRGCYK
jgi:hypothetical protein